MTRDMRRDMTRDMRRRLRRGVAAPVTEWTEVASEPAGCRQGRTDRTLTRTLSAHRDLVGGCRGRCHEDAEGVSHRVGVDVERFVLVVGTVEQQPGAECERSVMLPLEGLPGGDGEVQVQLLRDAGPRPGRRRQVVDLLEGELAAARVAEHQPVPTALVVLLPWRGLVARPVRESEELAVELGQATGIGGVED